jgi:hypothetical protein
MKRFRHLLSVLSIPLLAVTLLGGCPQAPVPTSEPTDAARVTDLTTGETAAVAAAARAAETLAQTTAGAQAIARADELPLRQAKAFAAKPMTFGSCPAVTLTMSEQDPLGYDLTLDFGTGCAPFADSDYACSGTATGSLEPDAKRVTLQLADLTCDGKTLGGSVGVTYEGTDGGIGLTGAWNVSYSDGAGSVGVSGNGIVSCDPAATATTVSSFTGAVSAGGQTWSAAMSDLLVSFRSDDGLIPSAGEITLTGENIRAITIRFDPASPTSGIVRVSLDGGPFFKATLPTYASL